MANASEQANMHIGARMERMRGLEQVESEGEARALIERDNGRFYVENETVEEFTKKDLQGVDNLRNTIGKGEFTESVRNCIYSPRNLPIAVKIIGILDRPSKKNDGRGESDIVKEAENARRSAHENVVWLHGFVVEEMTCYMCMELMQANVDEVKKVMHDQGGLNIGSKFAKEDIEKFLGCVTVAVVDGLSFLRMTARVMHRDIKPNNIMVNDRGHVKICDFGVSKRLQTGISSSRATTKDAGCIKYMAPEALSVVEGVGYGSKSGVWSLAISLHECAMGKHAFDGLSFAVCEHICNEDPPRIPRESGFSPNLRNFIDACLFKHEPDRVSLIPTDGNCIQKRKFYTQHKGRDANDRKNNVIEVLNLVTPHLPMLRRNLDN